MNDKIIENAHLKDILFVKVKVQREDAICTRLYFGDTTLGFILQLDEDNDFFAALDENGSRLDHVSSVDLATALIYRRWNEKHK